jgi:hypothetical protein
MMDMNTACRKNRHLRLIKPPYIRFALIFSWLDHVIEGLNIVGLSIKLEWISRIEAGTNLPDQFLLKAFRRQPSGPMHATDFTMF